MGEIAGAVQRCISQYGMRFGCMKKGDVESTSTLGSSSEWQVQSPVCKLKKMSYFCGSAWACKMGVQTNWYRADAFETALTLGSDTMFTWLNKQGVQSDEGFEVQRTGRFDAEYIEGGKVVTLEVQSGVSGGLPCISIDPKAFTCWSDGTPISETEQARLSRNFRAAMQFQGLKVVEEAAE